MTEVTIEKSNNLSKTDVVKVIVIAAVLSAIGYGLYVTVVPRGGISGIVLLYRKTDTFIFEICVFLGVD